MPTAYKKEFTGGRTNVLTGKSAAELAASKEFDARVKAHCFFSAKVCEARILDKLRGEVDKYLSGQQGSADAVHNMQTFLRGRGYATGEGIRPPAGVSVEDWKRARRLSNLASTARLELILKVNLRQANAVRRYAEMRGSGAKYCRYVASTSRERRADHAALVGMVLPADSPFWRGFPRDYQCKCSYEEVFDDDEAAKYGGAGTIQSTPQGEVAVFNGKKVPIVPNPSGFHFDADTAFKWCDMSRIKHIPARRACLDSLAALAQEKKIDIHVMPGKPMKNSVVLDVEKIRKVVENAIAEREANGYPNATSQVVGSLSEEICDAMGLDINDRDLVFQTANEGSGLDHDWGAHHNEWEKGLYLKVIAECSESGATTTLTYTRSGAIYSHIVNGKNMITLRKLTNKQGWTIVSIHGTNAKYAAKRQRM